MAINAMKAAEFPGKNCLNVCEMVLDPNDRLNYPMTLLAFAGYHVRFEMLDLLIEEGASKPCIYMYRTIIVMEEFLLAGCPCTCVGHCSYVFPCCFC